MSRSHECLRFPPSPQSKPRQPLVDCHPRSVETPDFDKYSRDGKRVLLTPLVLKWLIDGIIPHKHVGLLAFAVALIFVGHEGRISLTSLGSYLMLTASQKMSLSLRVSLLRHFDTLGADFYESTPVGTIMYPLKEPIDEISYLGSDLLPAILRMLFTTGFTLVTMFVLSPLLTVACFLLFQFP
jgi:ABC-type multidrug transport system fused ATPase/permease subunit